MVSSSFHLVIKHSFYIYELFHCYFYGKDAPFQRTDKDVVTVSVDIALCSHIGWDAVVSSPEPQFLNEHQPVFHLRTK